MVNCPFLNICSSCFVSQMEVEVNVAPVPSVTPAASRNICVRAGCTNPAVESKDWDKEYCSNECVATHCRWAQKRQHAGQIWVLEFLCFFYVFKREICNILTVLNMLSGKVEISQLLHTEVSVHVTEPPVQTVSGQK